MGSKYRGLTVEASVINDRLEMYYGREIDGRPRYRISWTTAETEKRIGEFNEFYGSIYLRTFKGIKEVPKYPYDKDRWVLEKLFYIKNPELVSEKPGSYEPFHILKDSTGAYLPLNWKVIDFIVSYAEQKPVGIKLTDKDFKADEQKAIDMDTKYFEDILEDQGRSPLFAFENSVFVDATKRF